VKKSVQHGFFVESIDPVAHLLALQASCYARIIVASHLPTQAFRQVLRAFVPGVLHGPPPAAAWRSAIAESGPQIEALAALENSLTIFMPRDAP
jgi:hypothetical protein